MPQREKEKQSERKHTTKSLMSRNVTEFRHLLNKCQVNENDLNWAMGLRDNHIPRSVPHRQPSAPEVFFKKTMLSSIRDQLKSKQKQAVLHANEYDYMLTRNFQNVGVRSPKQTKDQIAFYSKLRQDSNLSKVNTSNSQKQFSTIPSVNRQLYPSFIKKEFIKKTSPLGQNEIESAFDGDQKQQPYTNKFKTRNYGFFEPMTKAKGRSKVALPTIAWEMGLRDY